MTFSPRLVSPSASGLPFPTTRFVGAYSNLLLSDHEPVWLKAVRERLDALCALPQGWDGYKAGPTQFTTAYFAMKLLESSCDESVQAPDIVPGPSGDLQIEWHTVDGDIEIHVRRPNEVNAWRSDTHLGEDGEELSLTNNFEVLKRWIGDLLGERLASAA